MNDKNGSVSTSSSSESYEYETESSSSSSSGEKKDSKSKSGSSSSGNSSSSLTASSDGSGTHSKSKSGSSSSGSSRSSLTTSSDGSGSEYETESENEEATKPKIMPATSGVMGAGDGTKRSRDCDVCERFKNFESDHIRDFNTLTMRMNTVEKWTGQYPAIVSNGFRTHKDHVDSEVLKLNARCNQLTQSVNTEKEEFQANKANVDSEVVKLNARCDELIRALYVTITKNNALEERLEESIAETARLKFYCKAFAIVATTAFVVIAIKPSLLKNILEGACKFFGLQR